MQHLGTYAARAQVPMPCEHKFRLRSQIRVVDSACGPASLRLPAACLRACATLSIGSRPFWFFLLIYFNPTLSSKMSRSRQFRNLEMCCAEICCMFYAEKFVSWCEVYCFVRVWYHVKSEICSVNYATWFEVQITYNLYTTETITI